jgi:hypothetical protein
MLALLRPRLTGCLFHETDTLGDCRREHAAAPGVECATPLLIAFGASVCWCAVAHLRGDASAERVFGERQVPEFLGVPAGWRADTHSAHRDVDDDAGLRMCLDFEHLERRGLLSGARLVVPHLPWLERGVGVVAQRVTATLWGARDADKQRSGGERSKHE